MSFREVRVHEIREVLRLWLRGEGQRSIARRAVVDRKTVRRYVEAALACGLDREGGEEQLTDELVGQVCERVRPHRADGHGEAWATLRANHDQLKTWLVEEGPDRGEGPRPPHPARDRRARAHVAPLRPRGPRRRTVGAHQHRAGGRRRPGRGVAMWLSAYGLICGAREYAASSPGGQRSCWSATPAAPHIHSASRNARSASGGRYRPGRVRGGAVLARAFSFRPRSAWR